MKLRPFGCIPILIVIALLLWLPLLDVSIPGMMMALLRDGAEDLLRWVIVQLTELSQGNIENATLQMWLDWGREMLWQHASAEEQAIIERFFEIRNEAQGLGGTR